MDAIPLFNLTQQTEALAAELSPQLEAVLKSGSFINGPYVRTFEEQLAQYLTSPPPTELLGGARPLQVISCNSGTDALYLALRALNIGPGDDVLTSVFSFFASAEAISLTGARPVFVDINPATFNLDPDQLTAHITPRTRAIIPVHLFGQAVDMTKVMAIAETHQLAVVEDCAQAIGACWNGRQVGTWGHVGCYSFYPTKNLGAFGDGGALATSDSAVATRARQLKDHGQNQQYLHANIGINSRLDALQAVVLSVKLPHLREWTWRRRILAERYQSLLQGIPEVKLPYEARGGRSVWNQFTIQVATSGEGSWARNQMQQYLKEQSIGSRIYYPVPLHLQPAYQTLGYAPGDFPCAEASAHRVLSLPLFPELTEKQVQHVCDTLRQGLPKLQSSDRLPFTVDS